MPIRTGDKSGRTFFAMRFATKGLLALILFASCATALHAQSIQINLVNGKTGRPWTSGTCVSVWLNITPHVQVDIPTNKNGVAQLRLTDKDSEVDIPYDLKLNCGGGGAINPVLKYDDSLFVYTGLFAPSCGFPKQTLNAREKEFKLSTKEVLQHGFVSENTCGTVTASPQPGQVILFVRPRNHQEKRHDCLAGELPILCR